jgi:hypothetical protein
MLSGKVVFEVLVVEDFLGPGIASRFAAIPVRQGCCAMRLKMQIRNKGCIQDCSTLGNLTLPATVGEYGANNLLGIQLCVKW